MRGIVLPFLLILFAAGISAAPPELATNAAPVEGEEYYLNNDGYYRIEWEVSEGTAVLLQEANSLDFTDPRQIYEGEDLATVISGRLDGTYYYRARRADEQQWSEPIVVKVVHHSLRKAFLFLGMGAVVFLATAVLIIGGHVKHRQEFGKPAP